jgi:Rieske 2Fe-2S family protein
MEQGMDTAASPSIAADDIAERIHDQRAGFSLDQSFYVDPAIFARDVERFLARHWLVAGHESSAPNPGDWFRFELASEQVIIARGQDRVLRAFANVCRHRGSRVCAESEGHSKSFVCPYHAWTYGLDGSLQAARHMPPDFDRSSYGLKPVHMRVIEGIVFVTLSPNPLSLAHVESTVKDCLGPYGWATARVAHRETYPIKANWKLAVENYLECYHCGPAHPEYSKLHALEQPLARIEKLDKRMRERAKTLGIDIPTHDHWVPSSSGEEAAYGFRYPLYDGVATGSRDGSPLAPLMGRFSDYDGALTSVHLGPGSFLVGYPDHGVIYRFIAQTVDRCALEVIWLVRGDAEPGRNYDPAALTWLWQVTSESDKRIFEENQFGVASRFYEPGPYAPMEANAQRYVRWYLGEIA